jgi:hypothetical protein
MGLGTFLKRAAEYIACPTKATRDRLQRLDQKQQRPLFDDNAKQLNLFATEDK